MRDLEDARKKDVMYKINLYCERFPSVSARLPKMKPTASLQECEEVLCIAREIVSSQNSVNNVIQTFNMGMTIFEAYWGDGSKMAKIHPMLGMNLTGMSKLFREGKFPELDPLICEIDIEYPWIGRRSLLLRFASTMGEMMMKVHLMNTNPAARKILEMASSEPKIIDDTGL
jgi:hypothetical protein